jgi:hypothetical protein
MPSSREMIIRARRMNCSCFSWGSMVPEASRSSRSWVSENSRSHQLGLLSALSPDHSDAVWISEINVLAATGRNSWPRHS